MPSPTSTNGTVHSLDRVFKEFGRSKNIWGDYILKNPDLSWLPLAAVFAGGTVLIHWLLERAFGPKLAGLWTAVIVIFLLIVFWREIRHLTARITGG